MSEYLWDKSGEPDAEVERLETLLSSFGHTPRALALPSEEASGVSPRGWRDGAWRRLLPARLFEPAGLAVASALVLSLLLGASVLMRARVAMNEDRAASHAVRRQPPQASSTPASSTEAPTHGRRASPSTPQEIANAGRGSEPTDVQATSGGGLPDVRDVPRRRAGAQSFAFVKPRQKAAGAAAAGLTVARAGGTGTLGTMTAKGREGATSLFDGTRLMAKEQLIYALRLTGAKLKEVESKAHGAGEQKAGTGGGVR
jgi:hypothetical protein